MHFSQIHFRCSQSECWDDTEWGEALSCYLSSVQFPGTVVRVQFRSAQRSIQCASLCQIQMFYLLKGSNPVLCASLHQFRKAQRSNPMCFTVPNSNVLSSQGIKSSIMCLFALILLLYLFKGSTQDNVLLCTNSNVLSSQRIKSNIVRFFAPSLL